MLSLEHIIKSIKKRFSKKEIFPLSIIAVISICIILILHLMGTFSFLELKMYDFKFEVRDSLYSIDRQALDVSIIYSDDESYRLLTEKFSYPYPRGKIWAKAIENIASLGAKVIVLDYMFDAPDLNTTRSKNVRSDLLEGKYTKNQIEQQFSIEDNLEYKLT